jgi:hypothetical protein
VKTGALIATAAALLCAPAAEAAPVPLLDAPRAADIALAGREVVVASVGRSGRVTVDAVGIDTGVRRRVVSVPSPGRGWLARARLAASAERIAVLAGYDDDEGNPRELRVYSGPPSGPLEPAARVRLTRAAWLPSEIDVDGDRLLVVEFRQADRGTRARVLEPGGTVTEMPWPGIIWPPARLAGDRIAFLGAPHRDVEGPINEVFVADWRSGAVHATIDVRDPDDVRERGIDLLPDGRVLAVADGRLYAAAPGDPQSLLAPRLGRTWALPRFAGAPIAALRYARFDARRPVVLDAGSDRPRPLGSPSTSLETLVADERGAVWLANGCAVYAPLDGSAIAGAGACPTAEVVLEEGDQFVRGRRLRVFVTCIAAPAAGCRGTALVRSDGRVLGRGRFRVPAGVRRRVALRLTPRGLRHVRGWLRRTGEAFLDLGADVRDGRVAGDGTAGVFVHRIL